MEWYNGEPPDQIEVGVRLNVSYRAIILRYDPAPVPFQSFNMRYILKKKLLDIKCIQMFLIQPKMPTSTAQLQYFCENRTCPIGLVPTRNDCAIWHANVHTCHREVSNNAQYAQ